MGSTNSRRVGVVAALAAALVMKGGTAFASSPSTTTAREPVNPGSVLGGAYAVVVTTIADHTHLL